MRHAPPSRLLASIQGARVWTDVVGAGTTRIRIASRWARMLGFDVSAYLVGDLLVDTGFAHVRTQVLELLEGRRIAAVCCTHNHEDHTGNCGPIGDRHGCPVYLRHHRLRWTEGVRRLKPYRTWWWGSPGDYPAEEMPEAVGDGERTLRALPAPGHSITHVALWEEETATVFTGDLFIAPGASAVMVQENPYDLADSLRRVAAVEPRWMLTGHGMVVADPVPRLLAKAVKIEEAAALAVELHRAGMADRAIVREVFPGNHRRDRMIEALTQGEFSRLNFVRAARTHLRDA
ncbi:MAG: MBL fold metallo-hydrolase [Thermoanaerobaculales bacterium]|nr:MBL fold metallo-hydrolase [Thermoanaerobaculales bacterium]